MKLGNLVTTYENLAENETPVDAPLTDDYPDGAPLASGMDLSETPIDGIPESAFQDLEVTMEEEIFKAEQISQQLSLLEDTMNVIRSTGEVTEAQQRIINIQLRGLEPHMNAEQKMLMGRFTGAPYDPETAMVVTTEALTVGMSLVIAAVFAVVSILAFMSKGFNSQAVTVVSKMEKAKLEKVLDSMQKDVDNLARTNPGMYDLPERVLEKLEGRLAGITGRMFSIEADDRTFLNLMQVSTSDPIRVDKLVKETKSYLADMREATNDLADAMAGMRPERVKAEVEKMNKRNILFSQAFTAVGRKVARKIADAVGGDPSATYAFVFTGGFSSSVYEVDSTRGAVRMLSSELAAEVAPLNPFSTDIRMDTMDCAETVFGLSFKDLGKVIVADLKKSEKEINDAAKKMEENLKSLEGIQRDVADFFRIATSNIRSAGIIIANYNRDTQITIPRIVRAFAEAISQKA